jgi:hypothetical protein
LTNLTLKANCQLQDRHLAELAALTTLRSLHITGSGPSVTDDSVQELTQLSNLTWLGVDAYDAAGVSTDVAPASEYCGGRGLYITMRTSDDVASKVGCCRCPADTTNLGNACVTLQSQLRELHMLQGCCYVFFVVQAACCL